MDRGNAQKGKCVEAARLIIIELHFERPGSIGDSSCQDICPPVVGTLAISIPTV
jgi:hypothetical protein